MKFKILDSIHSSLLSMKGDCSGALYGIMSSNMMVITSFSVDIENKNGIDSYMEMQTHHPSGIDYCGVFHLSSSSSNSLSDYFLSNLKDVQVSDNPLLLERGTNGELKASILHDGRLKIIPLDVMLVDKFYQLFTIIRIQAILVTDSTFNFLGIQKKNIFDDSIFNFTGTEVYVSSEEINRSSRNITVYDVKKATAPYRDPRVPVGLVDVKLLPLIGLSTCTNSSVISLLPECGVWNTRINAPVNSLCIVENTRLIEDLFGLFNDTLYRQIQLFENIYKANNSNPLILNDFQQFHFHPEPLSQFLSFMFPRDNPDHKFKFMRDELHLQLSLPKNCPFFRRGNRLILKTNTIDEEPLLNVHKGLNTSGIARGKVATVKGLYFYYHYKQGNINDDGWGCAYRSLQTLFSWFRLQGYTDSSTPTVKEIQECLVQIGDKKKSFIGSKEWIGSAEVGYCLGTFLGITTLTLTLASGASLLDIANDLLQHFELHGTPVMIGGGALAHTILGVHYNEELSSAKFLVLDPHYTGKDDIKIIQSKGWVGWKGLNFWKKQHFYNLCLPIKPNCL